MKDITIHNVDHDNQRSKPNLTNLRKPLTSGFPIASQSTLRTITSSLELCQRHCSKMDKQSLIK